MQGGPAMKGSCLTFSSQGFNEEVPLPDYQLPCHFRNLQPISFIYLSLWESFEWSSEVWIISPVGSAGRPRPGLGEARLVSELVCWDRVDHEEALRPRPRRSLSSAHLLCPGSASTEQGHSVPACGGDGSHSWGGLAFSRGSSVFPN